MISRRSVLLAIAATIAGSGPALAHKSKKTFILDPLYEPQQVPFPSAFSAGTLIVDTANRFLYLVETDSDGAPLWHRRRQSGIGLVRNGRNRQKGRMAGLEAHQEDDPAQSQEDILDMRTVFAAEGIIRSARAPSTSTATARIHSIVSTGPPSRGPSAWQSRMVASVWPTSRSKTSMSARPSARRLWCCGHEARSDTGGFAVAIFGSPMGGLPYQGHCHATATIGH